MAFAVVDRELEVGDNLKLRVLFDEVADVARGTFEEYERVVLATVRNSGKENSVLAIVRRDGDVCYGDEGIRVRLIADIRRYHLADEGGGTIVFVVVELFVHISK